MAVATSTIPPLVLAPDDDAISHRNLAWKKFSRHRLALGGAVVLLVFVLAAILAKWLAPYDPAAIDPAWQGTPLGIGQFHHLLGTDELGRDMLSRLMYGGQISLTLAVVAMAIE